MALQSNVMSLCAGPKQISEYYPFNFKKDLVTSAYSQKIICKAKQACDLGCHEPPSTK